MILLPVYFANTTGLSSSQIERIKIIATTTYERVAKLIPISQTDVILNIKPLWIIPQTGIGGFSPNAGYALIHLEPKNAHFETSIKNELAAVIAHELHHCARNSGVGYGRTLLEALVTEGLACAFEIEFRDGQIPMYAAALEPSQISELLARATAELYSRTYNHENWFFGSREQEIPRWAGYSLGYEIVKKYLEKTGLTAASQWNTSASSFERKDSYE